MSYNFYFQPFQPPRIVVPGMYNVPMHITRMQLTPDFTQIQSFQPTSAQGYETITIDSDCEDDLDEDDVGERSLFCANLDKKVTEELLYEVFLQAGPVQKVHIPKDNAGKPRSYGFVTFKYRSSAYYAIRLLKGLSLYGTRLDIKFQRKSN